MNIKKIVNRIFAIVFFVVILLMTYDLFNKHINIYPITQYYVLGYFTFYFFVPIGLKYKKENKMIRYFVFCIFPIVTIVILGIIMIHNYATGFLTVFDK